MSTTTRVASPLAAAATLAAIGITTAVVAQATAPALIEAASNPSTSSTEIVSGYLSPENFEANLKQKYYEQKAAETLAIQNAVAEKMQADAAAAAAAAAPAAPAAAASAQGGASGDVAAWASSAKSMSVKNCESGNNYSTNTGNGYYGAWQFDIPSWHANGGGAYAATPDQAPAWAQDQVAYNYYQKAGWGPWSCG